MNKSRTAHFCPMCGTTLEMHERYGQSRPMCPACGHIVFFTPNVAVLTLIVDGERVLLVKRRIDPKKGLWVCPAGFMEWDENPQAAAARECREETGLDVRIERLIDVYHTPDDGGLADMVIAYLGTITGGTLGAADDAEEVAWFTRDELPELAFMPTERVIARWSSGEL